MSRRGSIVVCAAFAVAFSSSISAAVSYSLKDDFSTVSNPNEVWSYNYGGAPVGPQDAGYIIGWGPASDMNGSIARVVSGGWHDAVPGDIVLHAPNSGTHSVTWTSPSDGIITITGKAWDAYFYSDRDCSWFLKVDGTTVAERGTVYGLYRSDTAADFASNVVLSRRPDGEKPDAGQRAVASSLDPRMPTGEPSIDEIADAVMRATARSGSPMAPSSMSPQMVPATASQSAAPATRSETPRTPPRSANWR